jgi:DNA-binding protein H-NS
MKTYSQIKAEIARLERQAESARKAEIAGVVGRIKEAIAAYGLTAGDLGFAKGRSGAKTVKSASRPQKGATTVGVAKYRDPASGKTWTGRGKPPNWILGVKNRDDLLISQPVSAGGKKARKAVAEKRRPGPKRKTSARKGVTAPAQSASVQIESAASQ